MGERADVALERRAGWAGSERAAGGRWLGRGGGDESARCCFWGRTGARVVGGGRGD